MDNGTLVFLIFLSSIIICGGLGLLLGNFMRDPAGV
jgi:hypothetical protein